MEKLYNPQDSVSIARELSSNLVGIAQVSKKLFGVQKCLQSNLEMLGIQGERVHSLDLSSIDIDREILQAFIKCLPNLTSLDLSNNQKFKVIQYWSFNLKNCILAALLKRISLAILASILVFEQHKNSYCYQRTLGSGYFAQQIIWFLQSKLQRLNYVKFKEEGEIPTEYKVAFQSLKDLKILKIKGVDLSIEKLKSSLACLNIKKIEIDDFIIEKDNDSQIEEVLLSENKKKLQQELLEKQSIIDRQAIQIKELKEEMTSHKKILEMVLKELKLQEQPLSLQFEPTNAYLLSENGRMAQRNHIQKSIFRNVKLSGNIFSFGQITKAEIGIRNLSFSNQQVEFYAALCGFRCRQESHTNNQCMFSTVLTQKELRYKEMNNQQQYLPRVEPYNLNGLTNFKITIICDQRNPYHQTVQLSIDDWLQRKLLLPQPQLLHNGSENGGLLQVCYENPSYNWHDGKFALFLGASTQGTTFELL